MTIEEWIDITDKVAEDCKKLQKRKYIELRRSLK